MRNFEVRLIFASIMYLITWLIPQAADLHTDFLMHKLKSDDTDVRTKVACIDSLLDRKDVDRDSLLMLKTELSYSIGDYVTMKAALDRIGDGKFSSMPLHTQCRLLKMRINALLRIGNTKESLQLCHKLKHLKKPDSLIYYDAFVNYRLFNYHMHDNHAAKSAKYIEETENILCNALKSRTSEDVLNQIKNSLYDMRFLSALHVKDYTQAMSYLDSLNVIPMSGLQKMSVMQNAAYLYMLIGEYGDAERIFEDLLSGDIYHYNQGVALMNYMHLLNSQGRYERTLEIYDRYKSALSYMDNELYRSYILANKADAEANTGLMEEAYSDMRESKLISDSLYSQSGMTISLNEYEAYDKDLKIEGLEKKADVLYFISISLCVVTLLCFVSLSVLFIRYRREIAEKNEIEEKLSIKGELLSGMEASMNEEKMRDAGKITAASLHLAGIEERNDRIREILRSRTKDKDEKLKALSEIMSLDKADENNRKLFDVQFEKLHSRFYNNLLSSHPDLTQVETRLCAYIIMNLSTKEIASLTNRTPRSVSSLRYRIGKKLGLSEEENLLTYLRKFKYPIEA